MYTLTKSGHFELEFRKGNKCGGETGQSSFHYEFTINTRSLDSRGFVIEHVEVSQAIEDWAFRTKFAGSCEQVMDTVARIIAEHAKEIENSAYLTLTVTRNGNAVIGIDMTYLPDLRATVPLYKPHKPKARKHDRTRKARKLRRH